MLCSKAAGLLQALAVKYQLLCQLHIPRLLKLAQDHGPELGVLLGGKQHRRSREACTQVIERRLAQALGAAREVQQIIDLSAGDDDRLYTWSKSSADLSWSRLYRDAIQHGIKPSIIIRLVQQSSSQSHILRMAPCSKQNPVKG